MLEKDFGKMIQSQRVKSLKMIITPDGKYLFLVSNKNGGLKQYNTEDMSLVKDYNNIHSKKIICLVADSESKYLYTACTTGYVKQIDIEKRE